MKTVTITLELTPDEVIAVMAVLQPSKVPTGPNHCLEVDLPVTDTKCVLEAPKEPAELRKPKVSMPGFGRSEEQVAAYTASESTRLDKADEEAEAKQERADTRAEKKAAKEVIEEVKKKEEQVHVDEVNAIKAADVLEPPKKVVDMIPPWLQQHV